MLFALLLALTHAQTGKQLYREGKLPEAIVELRLAVEEEPKNASAWYNLAYACRKAGKFDDAASAYTRYIELEPKDPDAEFGLAESQRQAGRAHAAAEGYRAYLAKEKRSGQEKWIALAQQHIAELEPAAAAGAERAGAAVSAGGGATAASASGGATAASASGGTAAGSASGGVRAMSAAGGADAGVAPVPEIVALVPAKAVPSAEAGARAAEKLAAGDALFAKKDYRGALFAFQDAALADPKSAGAHERCGNAYAKMGHDAEAAEEWRRAIALDPRLGDAHRALLASAPVAPPPLIPAAQAAAREKYARGVQLINEQQFDAAAAELDGALVAQPKFVEALIARGSARIGQGRFAEALADYQAAHGLDASLAGPLFGMAEAERGLGEQAKAAELYKQYATSSAKDVQAQLQQYAIDNARVLAKAAHP